ncbi:uncharacterized protein LOC106869642 [Octopus bimaculoides]|uniref:G-protein coupled receptors family 1 profile domain-containing protein n=1 Tax=Octopus bimaculoides TaxID=37653 RepID=A0A0L8HN02_OCTBM|nr:uncharacterized protein LOC106869642 [Octopus bimaculoides]|eukprot:XP_014770947.1 PREDICTED: uncharacterized protein LOC106869642 [Octopus bimaculoides]
MVEESTLLLILIAFAIGYMFFGTLNCVLSLAVLCRKGTKLLMMREYLIVLSIFDLGVLYSGLLPNIMETYDVIGDYSSDKQCKLTKFFIFFFLEGSSWMSVIITIERMVFVLFPYLDRSKRCQATSLVVLVTLLIIINAPMSILWKLEGNNCNGSSILKNSYLIKYSIIPSAILILSNAVITYKLCTQSAPARGSPNLQPVLLVFAISGFFLMTTFPASIILNNIENPDSILLLFLRLLLSTNNTFNFILYVIVSKIFREELLLMLKWKRPNETRLTQLRVVSNTPM